MAEEEGIESEEQQTGSGDDATQQKQETEKVKISKEELDALKQGAESAKATKSELENLKTTLYSPQYLAFLESQKAATQEPEETYEFLSQKELIQRVRDERRQDLQNLAMGVGVKQQEQIVIQQIKEAQTKYADFDALRPEMKKLAERVGGNLTADDCYKLLKSIKGEPLNLRTKPVSGPKSTEKPGTSSGTVEKTDFDEKEAIEEAARKVGLDKFLGERPK